LGAIEYGVIVIASELSSEAILELLLLVTTGLLHPDKRTINREIGIRNDNTKVIQHSLNVGAIIKQFSFGISQQELKAWRFIVIPKTF